MEEMQSARHVGRDPGLPCSRNTPRSQQLCLSTSPEALWILAFWVLVEVPLHRCNSLNHWPLVFNWTLQPLPSPGKLGVGGSENSNSLMIMVGSPVDQVPSLVMSQKSLTHINWWVTPLLPLWFLSDFRNQGQKAKYCKKNAPKYSHCSYHLGDSKGFRNSVPGTGWRPKYKFLIIKSQYHRLYK